MSASAIIADVRSRLTGEPVYLTGSLVAEEAYGKTNAHSDVDLFCPTFQVLIATTQKLLGQGYTFADRFERVWYRWMRYGFNKWHTNSMRLVSPSGTETNLVYKINDGHPTTSLSQVIESFDFGLLGMGYDLEAGSYHDLRGYLFPGMDHDGPLPLMPGKRANWIGGFISQYNGMREFGRYVKYYRYGYDLSLVKTDMVTGYRMAELHWSSRFKPEEQLMGQIYGAIAGHMEKDEIDKLETVAKTIDYDDQLDVIMKALI